MDINFFEPIKKQKKQSNILMAIIVGIILAAALAIVSFSVMEIKEQEITLQSLNAINSRLESEGFAKQKDEISQLELSIASLNEKMRYVSAFEVYKNSRATGTTAMLSNIQSQITQTTLLTNLFISENTISLNAESSTLSAMAQFSYNIANCGYFQNVLVEAVSVEKIEAEDGGISLVYSYTINAVIVGADPAAAIEQMNNENEIEEETSSEEAAESEEN